MSDFVVIKQFNQIVEIKEIRRNKQIDEFKEFLKKKFVKIEETIDSLNMN